VLGRRGQNKKPTSWCSGKWSKSLNIELKIPLPIGEEDASRSTKASTRIWYFMDIFHATNGKRPNKANQKIREIESRHWRGNIPIVAIDGPRITR